MAATTQEHIPIRNIHDDLVILKDGSAAIVLRTSAVNFDLLSETEQLAIIDAFAALLNSLSFAIQIVISSKRLDISTYLESISLIEDKQTNPLLAQLMKSYRHFIETTTQENEVLDKQFYIVIQVSYVEISFSGDTEKNIDKALTVLLPRRDHIIRQFNRIGLKAEQLNNQDLLKLFYEFYNETPLEVPNITSQPIQQQPMTREVVQNVPANIANRSSSTAFTEQASSQPVNSLPAIVPAVDHQPQAISGSTILQKQIQVNAPVNTNLQFGPNAKSLHPGTPFIVEELPD